MHELGIVYEIIKTVDDVKREQNLTEIQSIIINVGEMRDIVPQFLKEAWQNARIYTEYPDAEFVVNVISANAKCKHCGHIYPVKNLGITCPNCNNMDFEIISGREFDIDKIIAK